MLLVEIAMLIYGIIVVVKGKFSVGKGKILQGGRARLCGGILISPIPLSFLIMLIWGIIAGASGEVIAEGNARAVGVCVGISVVFLALISALVLANILYKKQEKE